MINKFPEDFTWGTATASYQIEGAAKEDGRGESIWDVYCRTPGKVYAGNNGDVSTDHYHRYKDDIQLMKKLGVNSYRFSIAWPRIFPGGDENQNPKGIEFYHNLIDELIKNNIRPFVTLYHWDLPQALEEKGGWSSRDTVYAFQQYARLIFQEYGSKVHDWITLNEPYCSSILGYLVGRHAPGDKDAQRAYSAIHHLNMAHGMAIKEFRDGGYEGQIGTTLNLKGIRGATASPEDTLAADRAMDQGNRMFLDPLLGNPYPQRHIEAMKVIMPVESGDMELISQKFDFLGLNYYYEEIVEYDPESLEQFKPALSPNVQTNMGWPVSATGMIRLLKWVTEKTENLPLYITENGCCTIDTVDPRDGRVHDDFRVDYLKKHLQAVRRALNEGIPLKGYFLWSFIDNFEWAYGYAKQFGIVHCDYSNLERTPKDSYYYYRDVIAGFDEEGETEV